ncbi:MAG TPA: isopentenyl transferase family protein [Dictyobacter sp.]|jgi:2-phosphoglycerate kinase|nr:isopentenyl transferase family protein [Dictyobacter sp.]
MTISPPKNWEILLIGGNSGTGKSTVASNIAQAYGIPWLQVDDLRLALQFSAVTLPQPQQTEDLYFFLNTPDVWTKTAEQICKALIAAGEVMKDALQIVIESHIATGVPMILEGDGILPSLLTRPVLQPFAAKGQLKAVFLQESDEQALFDNMIMRNRGIEGRPHTDLRNESRAKQLFGTWISTEAEQYKLPVLPSQPWQTLIERVLTASNQ